MGSSSPWRDPEATQFPQGRPIIENARIPEFFNRLDWGLFIAIAVAVVAWFVISKTRSGFEYRIVGDSFDAARYAGIKVPKKVLGTFLASGAAAGLAGSILVAGILGKMDPRSLDLGLGFTGIIVAALARLNPIAIIPVAILMGALNNAGPSLQSIGVPCGDGPDPPGCDPDLRGGRRVPDLESNSPTRPDAGEAKVEPEAQAA